MKHIGLLQKGHVRSLAEGTLLGINQMGLPPNFAESQIAQWSSGDTKNPSSTDVSAIMCMKSTE